MIFTIMTRLLILGIISKIIFKLHSMDAAINILLEHSKPNKAINSDINRIGDGAASPDPVRFFNLIYK